MSSLSEDVKRLFTKGFSVAGVHERQASLSSGLSLANQASLTSCTVLESSCPGGVVQSSFVKDGLVSYDAGKYQAVLSHLELPQASSVEKSTSPAVAPYLDPCVLNSNSIASPSTQKHVKGWSRQQKRAFQRLRSVLTYWTVSGYQVNFMTWTTAKGGSAENLAYDLQRLKQIVENRWGFEKIEHIQIRTSEGNGVMHALWAWRDENPKGHRPKLFYIPYKWLSAEWLRIHGAWDVCIEKVRLSNKDCKRLSMYCVSQYVAGQSGFVRMSWSWGRIFGFPLVGAWCLFKKWGLWGGNYFNYTYSKWRYKAFLSLWDDFLSGLSVSLGKCKVSMSFFRMCYVDYGALHWRAMLQALIQGYCYVRKLNK